ncbi:unnamed protein product [Lampetra fluviatilis]
MMGNAWQGKLSIVDIRKGTWQMTDVVVAEGSVKLREGKKWKTRWVVLKKPSPVADCLNLLAFKDRRDSCIVESKKERGKGERERHKERDKQKERLESERERADLFLESVCGLEGGLSLEGCDHVLAIISLTQVLLLGFDSPRSLAEWDEQLRDCLGEVHSFAVWVPAGSRLESGPATLHFRHNAFVLTRHAPPALLAHWHLAELRRYGAVPGGFAFEGGTRSAAGAGVFFLACTEADQICFLFDCFVAGFASPRTFRRAPTLSAVHPRAKAARAFTDSSGVSGSADEQSDGSPSDSLIYTSIQQLTMPPEAKIARSPLLHRASAVITDKSRLPTKPHLPSPVTEPSRRISSDSGITTVTRSGSGSASGSFSSCSGSAGGSASDEFESLSIPAKGPEASSTIPPAFHQGAEKSECRFPYVTNWWYAVPRRELHSNCPSTCLYKERHSQQEAGKSAPLRTSDTAQRMDAATAAEPVSLEKHASIRAGDVPVATEACTSYVQAARAHVGNVTESGDCQSGHRAGSSKETFQGDLAEAALQRLMRCSLVQPQPSVSSAAQEATGATASGACARGSHPIASTDVAVHSDEMPQTELEPEFQCSAVHTLTQDYRGPHRMPSGGQITAEKSGFLGHPEGPGAKYRHSDKTN